MRTSSIALLLPLLLIILSVAADPAPGRRLSIGGWKPIGNLNDPHVLDIANFAITEHNKQAYSKLVLSKVVKGETQVVSGTNYKLVLLATNENSYEVIVWEKEKEKEKEPFRKLTSFNLVKN